VTTPIVARNGFFSCATSQGYQFLIGIARRELAELAGRLRFGRTAGPVLWYLHAALLAQR